MTDADNSNTQLYLYDIRFSKTQYATYSDLFNVLSKISKKFIFQEEKGDKNGYLHYGGRISLFKKMRKHKLLDLFEDEKKPHYCEGTNKNLVKDIKNNPDKFYHYHDKDHTREAGPWTDKDKKPDIYIPRQYRYDTLLEWQQQALKWGETFDSRRVYYIYDPIGNNGKSVLTGIIALKHGGIVLPQVNDYKDMMQYICNRCMDQNIRSPPYVILDLPRALKNIEMMYTAIESIKNGHLWDMRNHAKEWYIDSPCIIVFSNNPPSESLQSKDRWCIYEIVEKKLVKYSKPPKPDINDDI